MKDIERQPPRARDFVLVFCLSLLAVAAVAVVPSLACGLGCRAYDAVRGGR